MRPILYTYEHLCEKYGKKLIDHLETYEYWQLETKGTIYFAGKEFPLKEWVAIKKKEAKPFANYDYEDDDYTFKEWVNIQAELDMDSYWEMR
jgi:hypothetical protein